MLLQKGKKELLEKIALLEAEKKELEEKLLKTTTDLNALRLQRQTVETAETQINKENHNMVSFHDQQISALENNEKLGKRNLVVGKACVNLTNESGQVVEKAVREEICVCKSSAETTYTGLKEAGLTHLDFESGRMKTALTMVGAHACMWWVSISRAHFGFLFRTHNLNN